MSSHHRQRRECPVRIGPFGTTITVVPGHEAGESADRALDLGGLAHLVVLMSGRTLPDVVDALVTEDVPPETPAVTVERATLPDETVVMEPLGSNSAVVSAVVIEPPAVTINGDVVAVGKVVTAARIAGLGEDATLVPGAVSPGHRCLRCTPSRYGCNFHCSHTTAITV